MQAWSQEIIRRITQETHFDGRQVSCFGDRPRDLNAMFAEAVARNGAGEALVCDGERLSYDALARRVGQAAAGLAALGVTAGDRVALLLSNSPEFVIVLLATIRLGAIAVPINTREGTPELAHILTDCGARVLVHDAAIGPRVPVPGQVAALEHRISVGGPCAGALGMEVLERADAHVRPVGAGVDVGVGEEDTAVILYTSGTTGQPKGAMLTHFNIVHSAMHFEACMGLGARERSLLAVPASHVTGLVATLFTMLRTAGCSVILRSFAAETFLDLMRRERVTQTLMVPAMYNLFLLRCNVAEYDLSHWKIGGYGGAPMPEATIRDLAEQLPGLELVNAYGATELTSPATILPVGFGVSRADSVGVCVPCGEIRVKDRDGGDVPAGTPGELWIKGPMVVPGYWNNPEKTAAEFQDGYWKSGDVGSVDAEGFVRLHDRRKDMIIRGGYNIYSAEIENTLCAHPQVIECAALGRADPVLGEKLHVVIYTEAPELDGEEVRGFCAARLADYKIPDFVTLRDVALPRNANGKILKAVLRDSLGAG